MSRENDMENMDTAIEQTTAASGQTEADASLGTVTESDVNASEESGEKSGKKNGKKSGKKSKKKKSGKNSLLLDLLSFIIRIGWILLFLVILLQVVCGITVNRGERMSPMFNDRDIVVYYRLDKSVNAREVIVFEDDSGNVLLGRVVAKTGDTVDIDERGLKINGYYQTEKYAHGDTVMFEGGIAFPLTLGEEECFVLCDDRSNSLDSRTLGPVPFARMLGRVMLQIRQRDF
ncbi:MAG: signal peptidase I [Clostridia bacterium]|nr:signal peptidase I [Clostridia bacterium]